MPATNVPLLSYHYHPMSALYVSWSLLSATTTHFSTPNTLLLANCWLFFSQSLPISWFLPTVELPLWTPLTAASFYCCSLLKTRYLHTSDPVPLASNVRFAHLLMPTIWYHNLPLNSCYLCTAALMYWLIIDTHRLTADYPFLTSMLIASWLMPLNTHYPHLSLPSQRLLPLYWCSQLLVSDCCFLKSS